MGWLSSRQPSASCGLGVPTAYKALLSISTHSILGYMARGHTWVVMTSQNTFQENPWNGLRRRPFSAFTTIVHEKLSPFTAAYCFCALCLDDEIFGYQPRWIPKSLTLISSRCRVGGWMWGNTDLGGHVPGEFLELTKLYHKVHLNPFWGLTLFSTQLCATCHSRKSSYLQICATLSYAISSLEWKRKCNQEPNYAWQNNLLRENRSFICRCVFQIFSGAVYALKTSVPSDLNPPRRFYL